MAGNKNIVKAKTSHELAKLLLEYEDLPVLINAPNKPNHYITGINKEKHLIRILVYHRAKFWEEAAKE